MPPTKPRWHVSSVARSAFWTFPGLAGPHSTVTHLIPTPRSISYGKSMRGLAWRCNVGDAELVLGRLLERLQGRVRPGLRHIHPRARPLLDSQMERGKSREVFDRLRAHADGLQTRRDGICHCGRTAGRVRQDAG